VLTALAISAALHAVLLAALAHERAPARVPVEVEIRGVHRERPAASPAAPGQKTSGAETPRGERPSRSGAVTRRGTSRVLERGTAAWFEAEGLGRAAPLPPGPDALRPRPSGGGARSDEEGEAPAPVRDAHEVNRWGANVLRDFRTAERARVSDRELGDMQAALADRFDVPWSTVEGRAGTAASRTLARLSSAYARAAEGYGRTGRPPAEDAFAQEIVALVRVTSGEDGRAEVELAASSGYREYDRLAVARVRAMVVAEVGAAALRKHPRTLWAFLTRFEIIPPVPVIGCGFDALFHLDRCVYPLKRLPPASRVELRGVE
jgi:hypothetical protein